MMSGMGLRLALTFEGDDVLDRTLERFELGVQSAEPVFDALGDALVTANRRQFSSEGAYGSGGWDPLSPKYAAWKATRYPGQPILQATGTMMESVTERPMGVEAIEAQFAVFGTGVEYAAYHQQGTPQMPQRRIVELPESVRRGFVKGLQEWLVQGTVSPISVD